MRPLQPPSHHRPPGAWAAGAAALALVLGGCATRSTEIQALPTSSAAYATWDCERLFDEQDAVQRRAADVAYAVDERAAHNIMALSVGLSVFWPALFAMRPAGPEANDLAQLKGRYEALRQAAAARPCGEPAADLTAERAAALPVALGERLVYEDRPDPRRAATEWVLQVTALRRGEIEYQLQAAAGSGTWRHDPSGNILAAPASALQWSSLLRFALDPGQLVTGDIVVLADPLARARLRGQVMAVGPQVIAGRRFDAAVLELFGDVQRGDAVTRADGALVVDRRSGVLLRLDLRSADPAFSLQRRLMRIEPAPP